MMEDTKMPLGQVSSSKLNVLSQKHTSSALGNPLFKTHLSTPSNSPLAECFNKADTSIDSVLNAQRTATQLSSQLSQFYSTPPTILKDSNERLVAESYRSHTKGQKQLTTEQVRRLRLRVQLAYYKFKTQQVHLKFSEITKTQGLTSQMKHRRLGLKNLTSSKTSRKLAGSANNLSSNGRHCQPSRSFSQSQPPERTQCITPEKGKASRQNVSASSISSGYTPVSMKAAKSLLQMFSTGS